MPYLHTQFQTWPIFLLHPYQQPCIFQLVGCSCACFRETLISVLLFIFVSPTKDNAHFAALACIRVPWTHGCGWKAGFRSRTRTLDSFLHQLGSLGQSDVHTFRGYQETWSAGVWLVCWRQSGQYTLIHWSDLIKLTTTPCSRSALQLN